MTIEDKLNVLLADGTEAIGMPREMAPTIEFQAQRRALVLKGDLVAVDIDGRVFTPNRPKLPRTNAKGQARRRAQALNRLRKWQ